MCLPVAAQAQRPLHTVLHAQHSHSTTQAALRHGLYRHAGARRYAARRSFLQCVAYARSASGIELSGNAVNWWDNAAGVYARGSTPEPGSILNFRANGHMRLGHVAVVTALVNAREIEIEHANWAGPGARRGGVSRGIAVVDVSPNNDWTAVRVGLGRSGDFGSIYPTYGFIYDRPDQGGLIEAQADTTPAPAPLRPLNPAPRDLRPASERSAVVLTNLPATSAYDEVAEAPAARGLLLDAPDRNFR